MSSHQSVADADSRTEDDGSSADYLIVGGGHAGCVLAARLLLADPHLSIIIIEAGPDEHENPLIRSPTGGPRLHNTRYEYNYQTAPQKYLANRRVKTFGGRVLSGCSAVNYGMWIRGAAADYDTWADLVQDDRWSYKSLLPYFRRSEHHHDTRGDVEQHGFEGPIHTDTSEQRNYPLRDSIRRAFESLGIEKNRDANGGNPRGIATWTENFFEGARQPAGTAYDLSGISCHTSTVVKRVLLNRSENGGHTRAIGVEDSGGRRFTARREVIVSCGALRTPQLLMLSGIGPAETLRRLGIQEYIDAPDVGQNLHDHCSCIQFWKLREPEKGLAVGSSHFDQEPRYAGGMPIDWIVSESPPLEGLQKAVKADSEDVSNHISYLRQDRIHYEMMIGYTVLGRGHIGAGIAADGTHISSAVLNLLPTSRGSVALESIDPAADPIIDPNYLATEADRYVLRTAVRRILQLMETPEGQSLVESESPPSGCAPLIASSSDTDIDSRLRDTAATMYHPAGTAAMGKVVDSEFRVFNVSGLRIVDASVIPIPIAAHYQALVYAMAEQAADMIAQTNSNRGETFWPVSDTSSNKISSSPLVSKTQISATENSDQDALPDRSRAEVLAIMLALCTAVFIAALDNTIITTAAPTIAQDIGVSNNGYAWLGSAYLLANAASIPLWGKLSDIFGRRPALTAANMVFLAGSLLAALSTNLGELLAGRAIQGVGGGGLIVLVNIVISDLFTIRKRPTYLGFVGGVWAVAGGLGPIIGGLIAGYTTWRWCFWINFFFGGASLLLLVVFLRIQKTKLTLSQGLRAMDWPGVTLITGATLMLLLGLNFGGVLYPWKSAIIICLIVFGAIAYGLFGLCQWRFSSQPIIPPSVFGQSSNLAALAVCFCQAAGYIASLYYLPLYFQAVLTWSPLLSGCLLLPYAVILAVTNMLVGLTIRKTGHYLLILRAGLALQLLSFGLFTTFSPSVSWPRLVIFQLLNGIAVGVNFQPPLLALQARLRSEDIATGTATFGFVRIFACAVSVVLGQVLFQSQVQSQSASLAETGIPTAIVTAFASGDSVATITAVKQLDASQRGLAYEILASSLSRVWILYAAISGLGLLCSVAIKGKKLENEPAGRSRRLLAVVTASPKVAGDEEKAD